MEFHHSISGIHGPCKHIFHLGHPCGYLDGQAPVGKGVVAAVQTTLVSNVLTNFCRKAFLEATKKSTEAACAFLLPENPGWYKDSPFYCGGWRGLLLATCSPAVHIPGVQ